MFQNRQKFDVLYRDALHRKRRGILCIGVCSITVEQDCAVYICEGILKTLVNINADLDIKKFKEEGCAGEKDLDNKKEQKRWPSAHTKIMQSPKKSL